MTAALSDAGLPEARRVEILVTVVRDLLSAQATRPSCQKGLLARCRCLGCATERARAAVDEAEAAAATRC